MSKLKIVELNAFDEDQKLHIAFDHEVANTTLCGFKFFNSTSIPMSIWGAGDRRWCVACWKKSVRRALHCYNGNGEYAIESD